MKILKIFAILLAVYAGIVVLFESWLGYTQPESGDTLVITTTDSNGNQNDRVDDGVDWLIESGIAAPGRVGIYGRGFGGYVALASALREPSRFRAVASFGGLTDLRALVDAPREYVNLDPNGPVYGTLPSDLALLEAISPAHQVERMRLPVLLGHGTKDPFVDVAQTQRLATALEAAGRPAELLLYRGALDVFLEAEQRIDFHLRLARFFEAHLRAVEPL